MKSPLKILQLEETSGHSPSMLAFLRKEGIPCEFVHAHNNSDFQTALERGHFDLVFVDHSPPSFVGLSALQAATAKMADTPFIFVSRPKETTQVSDALSEQACRYMVKDHAGESAATESLPIATACPPKESTAADELRSVESEVEILLLEASPDATLIAGEDRTMRQVNRQMEVMFGYDREELIGQPINMLLPDRFRAHHSEHVSGYAENPTIRRMSDKRGLLGLRKDGTEFPVAVALSPMTTKHGLFLIATIRDITQARQVEEELAQQAKELAIANENLRAEQAERQKVEIELRLAQKLEAIGQLAAGIAHEINTPMQFIGDSVHFLRQSFEDLLRLLEAHEGLGEAIRKGAGLPGALARVKEVDLETDMNYLRERVPRALSRTLEGIGRVTSIVRAMREFSHPHSEAKSPTDINRSLSNALMVSRNEYKYVADLETDFVPLPAVPCHANELNQVFLNLIVNAAHAIAEAVKGTDRKGLIRIRTAVVENAVSIQIEDSGTGIPEEIRQRIFNPFFTTKPVGQGTGQGLAIARSIIVSKHGGTLTFETEVGRGTTFEIRLPLGDGLTSPAGLPT